MGRLFDVAAAAAGVVVLSPIFAAAAVGIKLQDGGPVLYRAPGSDAAAVPSTYTSSEP